MARVAVSVSVSCTAQVKAERPRMVLTCLRGLRNDETAREIGMRPSTRSSAADALPSEVFRRLRKRPGRANLPCMALSCPTVS